MILCEKCNKPMIKASIYDPSGVVPLHGGKIVDGAWWVCINKECEEGKTNIVEVDNAEV
jgi:hypothetical protein